MVLLSTYKGAHNIRDTVRHCHPRVTPASTHWSAIHRRMSAVMSKRSLTHSFPQAKKDREGTKAAPVSQRHQPKQAQAIARDSHAAIGLDTATEDLLRKFDLTARFGPCTGISRLGRWQRAHDMGLEPPTEIRAVLERMSDQDKGQQSIWAGNV